MLFNSNLRKYGIWYDKVCDIIDSYDYYTVVTYFNSTPYKEYLFGKSLLGKHRDSYCIKILKDFLKWKDIKGLYYIRDIIPSVKGVENDTEIINQLVEFLKSDSSELIDFSVSILSQLKLYDKISNDAVNKSMTIKVDKMKQKLANMLS